MSICIPLSLLLLVALSFNLPSVTSTHHNLSDISPDINILGISISNDLPPGPPKLFFFADFEKNQVEIPHGNPYTRLVSPDDHTGGLRWKQCAEFSIIPALEKGHQRILWSVREDGLYHSWDNSVWDKRELWGTC